MAKSMPNQPVGNRFTNVVNRPAKITRLKVKVEPMENIGNTMNRGQTMPVKKGK